MRAELATTMDVPSWSEIVREVEPLFGSMPDFEAMLIRKIDQGAALCIRSHSEGDAACVLGGRPASWRQPATGMDQMACCPIPRTRHRHWAMLSRSGHRTAQRI
jgi:hypothetical protein